MRSGNLRAAQKLTRLMPTDKAARLVLIRWLLANPKAAFPSGIPKRDAELAIHVAHYLSRATRAEKRALKLLWKESRKDWSDHSDPEQDLERDNGCVGHTVQRIRRN